MMRFNFLLWSAALHVCWAGSSFTDVFVAPDVHWPQEEAIRRQLVYVAVSRARRRVWLVGREAGEESRKSWLQQLS